LEAFKVKSSMSHPIIIQGGMGVAVSGWPLAKAVSQQGQLGVVSGTLLAVVLAQGTIGLVQFWTGVPEILVSLHVLGAMLVIIATASLWCGARARTAIPTADPQAQMVAAGRETA